MANTVTVDAKTFFEIVNRLYDLTKEVEMIKAKVFKQAPKQRSNELKFDTVEDAVKWLNS